MVWVQLLSRKFASVPAYSNTEKPHSPAELTPMLHCKECSSG